MSFNKPNRNNINNNNMKRPAAFGTTAESNNYYTNSITMSPERIQLLYEQQRLPRGIYPSDINRRPTNSTGVQQVLASGGPSVPIPERPIAQTQPSRAPYLYGYTSPLSTNNAMRNPSFNPQQFYNESNLYTRRSARSTRQPTRASTRSGYNLQQLQAAEENWTPDQATFDSTYCLQPVIGHMPQSAQEQLLENLYEKHCRCRAHIGASYLQRLATAASYPEMGLDVADEERKLQSVPYARCFQQTRGTLRQLENQGFQVQGTPLPECGENFNFDNVPTAELAWFSFNKFPSDVLFQNLPAYIGNEQYLELIRPLLLSMLHEWQRPALEQIKQGVRKPQRYWRD
jgi:hypothetical protein